MWLSKSNLSWCDYLVKCLIAITTYRLTFLQSFPHLFNPAARIIFLNSSTYLKNLSFLVPSSNFSTCTFLLQCGPNLPRQLGLPQLPLTYHIPSYIFKADSSLSSDQSSMCMPRCLCFLPIGIPFLNFHLSKFYLFLKFQLEGHFAPPPSTHTHLSQISPDRSKLSLLCTLRGLDLPCILVLVFLFYHLNSKFLGVREQYAFFIFLYPLEYGAW